MHLCTTVMRGKPRVLLPQFQVITGTQKPGQVGNSEACRKTQNSPPFSPVKTGYNDPSYVYENIKYIQTLYSSVQNKK